MRTLDHVIQILALSCLLVGCGGGSDLVDVTPTSTYRCPKIVGPSVLVRLRADTRPPEERGQRRFVGRSFIGGNDLREPTDVSLLRILARDLEISGIFQDAALTDTEQTFVLDVTIERLFASYGEGVETLVLVLPTSIVDAQCRIKFQLRDRMGRLFLDEVYESQDGGVGSRLTGLQGSAIKSLSRSIRQTLDHFLPEIPAQVERFWKRFAPVSGP